MDTILLSQPSTYSRLIKHSFRLYGASFKKVFLLCFLLAITVFIPRLLSDLIGQDLFLHSSPYHPERLWLSAINLVGLVFFIGILWHMHCVIENKQEPLVEDLTRGAKKVLYVLIAAIIQSAIVFAVGLSVLGLIVLLHQNQGIIAQHSTTLLLICSSFMLQLVLILYIFTLFFFYVPIIAIENRGIFTALEKSASLVWNHWWRAFSVQLTPWLCYVILLALIRYLFHIDIHLYFVDNHPHHLWTTVLNLCIFTFFIPWVAALLLVQLNDLELRKQLSVKVE